MGSYDVQSKSDGKYRTGLGDGVAVGRQMRKEIITSLDLLLLPLPNEHGYVGIFVSSHTYAFLPPPISGPCYSTPSCLVPSQQYGDSVLKAHTIARELVYYELRHEPEVEKPAYCPSRRPR